MSHTTAHTTTAAVQSATRAVAGAIGNNVPYAVVGGSACVMLGGSRVTEDVDFVVPKDNTKKSRGLLRDSGAFTVDPKGKEKTKHTSTQVEIDILTPPTLFRHEFNQDTPTVEVGGVRVLHPLILLNTKCASILTRSSAAKKVTDGADITYLLQYCAKKGIAIDAAQVPSAASEVVEYLISQSWVPREAFEKAGYVDGSTSTLRLTIIMER